MKKKELDKAYKSIYNCIYLDSGEILSGPIRWNAFKNIRLKLTRKVSFQEIIKANLKGSRRNPSRNFQRVFEYEYKGYMWAVPFVVDEKGIFLKTIYPSRKLKKFYEKGQSYEKEK
ncbi:MAG: hypothetical protein WCK61_06475 [Candidatus Omnitrophota bacterium]